MELSSLAPAPAHAMRRARNRISPLHLLAITAISTSLACNRGTPADASVSDATADDATLEDVSEDSTPSMDAAPRPPAWPHELQPASAWGSDLTAPQRSVRVIIHAHSVHSHDACDGNPYVDGGPNEPCLQSFRRALCRTRVDAVFITEHSSLMAEGPFERVLQTRAGDRVEMEGGRAVAYSFDCDNGHTVTVLPGAENELMPIALREHPQTLPSMDLVQTYRTASVESVANFRAAGGFVVIPHAEQKEVAFALSLRPDGTELYNVHANLDPRIAGPYLNVDIGDFFADIPRFIDPGFRTEPDLLFLGLFRENVPDFIRWSALWLDGQTVVGVAGSDAHENTIQRLLADGERGDSYRRVFRWFNNELIIDGPVTRASLLAGLRAARARVRFEAWGSAEGFRFNVASGGSRSLADGSTVALSSNPVLEVTAPRVLGLDPSLPAPVIRVRVFKADSRAPTGWTEVASDPRELRFTVTEAGVYRAQADITPNHARPYLPRLERYVREVPWIYSGAVRVQ
ncbi:MAG: hypothetical protein U0269_03240 [Polyangiales bacterium]